MRAGTVFRASARHPKPLIIRAGLARTFGGVAGFVATLFLLLGLYLLRDAFEHPLDAQALLVLAAALGITLAVILFYYLLKPKPRHEERTRASWLRRAE